LNGFKRVNDQLGHVAGDDLLKQFSAEMRANSRSTDLIGRWGGDEFIVVLDCGRSEAQSHVERIKKWVVGDYTIEATNGPQKVQLDAAVGLAQWAPGRSANEVISLADAAMYEQKRGAR
jgi:two-component system cell cycle response regulator